MPFWLKIKRNWAFLEVIVLTGLEPDARPGVEQARRLRTNLRKTIDSTFVLGLDFLFADLFL